MRSGVGLDGSDVHAARRTKDTQEAIAKRFIFTSPVRVVIAPNVSARRPRPTRHAK
jgi:hypothetical protein